MPFAHEAPQHSSISRPAEHLQFMNRCIADGFDYYRRGKPLAGLSAVLEQLKKGLKLVWLGSKASSCSG
jgi:hypothetical protein